MALREFIDPIYIYRKRHRIIPYIFDELGGKLRCHYAASRLPLSENERQLAALRNKYKNKRAFVIGTGPSLKIADLNKLSNELTLASNKIFLAFDETDWRPSYYIAEDSLSIEASQPYFNSLSEVIKLFPFRRKQLVKHRENCIFFNAIWHHVYPKRPKFSNDALRYLVWGGTVTYTLIQFAIYLGVQEIYLLGVDCSYPVHANLPEKHQPFAVEGGSHGHFHNDYYRSGELIYPPNLHVQKLAYESAHYHCHKLGVAIFNASRGGELDIFPRVNFDSLIDL